MRITPEDLEGASRYLVLLNGKRIVDFVAADSDEGWIEILDIANLAPLNATEGVVGEDIFDGIDHASWEQVPIKRLTGDVKILVTKSA